jgi:DNA polymerase (family 10)
MLDRFEIATLLREIAVLLRFRGENRFRVRAYEAAADAVEVLREDLRTLILDRRLTAAPGIGPALAAIVAELHETGRSRLLDRLREGVPRGVAELTELEGLGAKKILALHRKLGIETGEDLRKACEARVVRRSLIPKRFMGPKWAGSRIEARAIEKTAKLVAAALGASHG